MDQKIAVVTGAARGIGRAMAEAFSGEGYLVVGIDVDQEALIAAADEIANFEAIVADVGDVSQIDSAFDRVAERHGRIDVLINNAGVTRRADLLELTEEDWDRITRVNAKGAFFCLQRVAKVMIGQGSGRIVNISSVAARGYHRASNMIYAMTKGGLNTLTQMAAHRLGPHGITVNAICPGITETEIYQGLIERDAVEQGIPVEEVKARQLATVPIRRSNTTEEVAASALYLASDAARNVTGQTIYVDGGITLI